MGDEQTMIDIGKIYCGGSSTGDGLRYGTEAGADAHGNAPHARPLSEGALSPIVVWSTTKPCNLKCVHCATDSENIKYESALTTKEVLKLIKKDKNLPMPKELTA